jgi:hypothetical protein
LEAAAENAKGEVMASANADASMSWPEACA